MPESASASIFDPASLVASMIVGGIGFVAFMYGKKQSRYPQMGVGLLMMVYPYFVPNVWAMSAIAVVLLAGLYGIIRLGW